MASGYDSLSAHTAWMTVNKDWHILLKDTDGIKRYANSGVKQIGAGIIFGFDQFTEDHIIILKSCDSVKYRVQWVPGLFGGLDVRTKDILLAVTDLGCRLRIYRGGYQNLLLYASELIHGAEVCVQIGYKFPNIAGKLKYIGPISRKSGTYFGVHLHNTCGDSNGTINGLKYFRCKANNGIFVSVDKLIVPATYEPTATLKEQAARGTDDVGDIQATLIHPGDRIVVKMKLQPNVSKKQVVTGTVVTRLLSGKFMGVEVDRETGVPLHPWDGCIKGKKVYQYSTGQTVKVALSDILISQPENIGSIPQDQIGQARGGSQSSHPTRSSRAQPSHMARGHAHRTVQNYQPHSTPPSPSLHIHPDVCTPSEPLGASSHVWRTSRSGFNGNREAPAPSGLKIRTANSSSSDKSTFYSLAPPDASTSSVPPSASSNVWRTPRSGSNDNREAPTPYGSDIRTARSSSKDKSSLRFFSRANPEPYPLKDFHITALSKNKDLCTLLARDLNLLDKWEELIGKDSHPYIRVDQFFKIWWGSIEEGHREERSKLLGMLVKYDMEDLADHINTSPDQGSLHKSVFEPFMSEAVKKWGDVASHLGVNPKELGTVLHSMTDYEKLREILRIWQVKPKRTRCRVHEFVEMCCKIGLCTFATQVGQGLGIGVLTNVASVIPPRCIKTFREALQISSVRWNAFLEKYKYQSDSIYEMLCYWSLIQPLDAPKIHLLAEALKRCGLEKVANESLHRGLPNEDMEMIAFAVGDKWFRLAKALELCESDLVLLQGLDTSSQRAFKALQFWRGHQLDDASTNLRKLLLASLMTYRLHEVARRLIGAPEYPSMHESVISAVTEATGDSWMKVAEELHLKEFEIADIPNTMHPQEKVGMILEMWQERDAGAQDKCKIHELVGMCRATGQNMLAMQIEQGLDEDTLQSIGREVNMHQYHHLCEELVIPQTSADALEKAYPACADRVYRSLCYWSFVQPLEPDKVQKLDEALVRVLPQEELTEDDLGTASIIIDDKWLQLANGLRLPPNQMEWVIVLQKSDPLKALNALHLWRLRALGETHDLKQALYSNLIHCEMFEAARQLYGGFDPETIAYLAQKLSFDWPVLAKHFGYNDHELSKRLRAANRSDMSLIIMKEWLDRSLEGGVEDTRRKLREGLKNIGREDITEWLNRRNESDQGEIVASRGKASRDNSSVEDHEIGAVSIIPDQSLQLECEAAVEVFYGGETLPGTIKWIGEVAGVEDQGKIAGLELDDFLPVFGSDGKFNGRKYFECQYGRGLFLPLSRCKPDSRFVSVRPDERQEKFGGKECEPIDAPTIPPPKELCPDYTGMYKGIQGDNDSSCMDTTLYSMFAFSSVFDASLEHGPTATRTDISGIKDILRRTIVNPLRRNGFVRADYLAEFRGLLSSTESIRVEEVGPGEFIPALLQDMPPFLKISQGNGLADGSYMYQISLDKSDQMQFPSVEELLHQSSLQLEIKLLEMPSCLIIQLPRHGKKRKVFRYIKPSLKLDIKLLIKDTPRTCSVCGCLASVECGDCRPENCDDDLIQSYCGDCSEITHSEHTHQEWHRFLPLNVPMRFVESYHKLERDYPDDVAAETSHLYDEYQYPMELFSVICIDTSHYVAFVRTFSGNREEWAFFDSMADRTGDEDGYNIPEVVHLRDFQHQMESTNLEQDLKRPNFRHLKRLMSDAYICFYRPVRRGSPD